VAGYVISVKGGLISSDLIQLEEARIETAVALAGGDPDASQAVGQILDDLGIDLGTGSMVNASTTDLIKSGYLNVGERGFRLSIPSMSIPPTKIKDTKAGQKGKLINLVLEMIKDPEPDGSYTWDLFGSGGFELPSSKKNPDSGAGCKGFYVEVTLGYDPNTQRQVVTM